MIKLIIISIIFVIITTFSILYFNNNKAKPVDLNKKIADAILSDSSSGIYLYSEQSKTLYYKNKNGSYFIVKDGTTCTGLMNKSIPIKDITQTFYCDKVPEKYKNKCSSSDPTTYITVTIKTAQEFEDSIKKSPLIDPNLSDCVSDSTISDTDFNAYTTIESYIKEHADDIKELAIQYGIMKALEKVLNHWAILVFIIPMITSSQKDMRVKGGIQSAAFLGPLILSKVSEAILEWQAKSSAEAVGKEALETTMECVTYAAREALFFTRTALQSVIDFAMAIPGVDIIAGLADFLMMAGMALDALDFCGLRSGYFTQDILNKYKTSLDLSIQRNDPSFLEIFDASNVCSYQLLETSSRWNFCLSDDDKKKYKDKEEYSKSSSDGDNINKYQNEYLNNLQVNSLGQPLLPMYTNIQLAAIFNQNVGGIDWSSIATDQYVFGNKNNKIGQQLALIFTDENVVYASYVYHYFYILIIFIIILLFFVFYDIDYLKQAPPNTPLPIVSPKRASATV
jgi:hypothetical protein